MSPVDPLWVRVAGEPTVLLVKVYLLWKYYHTVTLLLMGATIAAVTISIIIVELPPH